MPCYQKEEPLLDSLAKSKELLEEIREFDFDTTSSEETILKFEKEFCSLYVLLNNLETQFDIVLAALQG